MARRQAVPAKILRPVTTGSLPRERLFERLDQVEPLIWVSGPAGCGKTTLVASYVKARGLPYLWYRLDPGDRDLASFFYYLGLAGHRAAPRRKRSLPLLTPEYLQGIPDFSRSFFTKLFDRLKPPALLVLDDAHELAGDGAFFEALRVGLTRRPDGVRCVFAGGPKQAGPAGRLRGPAASLPHG